MNRTEIEKARASGFEGWGKAEFIAAMKEVGLPEPATPAGMSVDYMRQLLTAVVGSGLVVDQVPAQNVGSAKRREKIKLGQQPPPGLDGRSKWSGKRRLVTIVADDVYTESQLVPFEWIDTVWHGKPGVPNDPCPWPQWNALKNAVQKGFKVEDRFIPELGRMEPVKVPHNKPLVNYTSAGDDPNTAHLPESLLQWYQWQCEDTNYFEGANRRQLLAILVGLTDGTMNRDTMHGEPDEYVREKVLERLGVLEQYELAKEAKQAIAA